MIDHFQLDMILDTLSRKRREDGAWEMCPSLLSAASRTESLHGWDSPHGSIDNGLLLFCKMIVNTYRKKICKIAQSLLENYENLNIFKMSSSVDEYEMDKKVKRFHKRMTTVTTTVICSCTCNDQNTEIYSTYNEKSKALNTCNDFLHTRAPTFITFEAVLN